MALSDLLALKVNPRNIKQEVTPERIEAIKPVLKQYISFWRAYPDIFVETVLVRDNPENFHLYFYQRVMLRVIMRHKYAYCTFPRAMGKSFMAVLILMLRCILYPRSHVFVSTGGKDQAASITLEKAEELRKLIPGINYELDMSRGKTKTSKADLVYDFKNGSKLDILAASQRSRGARRTGGLIEECILIDEDILNEVLIPTLNINRRLTDGSRDENEPANKALVFVTTAGWKNSFAYNKCIETLVQQITEPGKAFCMGGSWRIPVMEKLISKNFVQELRLSGTYNDASFAREYESEWAGDVESAFFSIAAFDRHRVNLQPEYEFSGRSAKGAYYVLAIDVGRLGDQTEILVIKVTPHQRTSVKSIVNIYSFEATDFEEQAINIKRLFYKYKAKVAVIDGNGLGVGLIDFMTKTQIDPDTGDILYPFGVVNDEKGTYKNVKNDICEADAIYIIKANAPINTEAHTYVQTQMANGKIKFLIDEVQAKAKLMATKMGASMTSEQRAEYLKPFTLTSVLREQMANLVQQNEGVNIILKQSNKKIKKDKYSALAYGLYYIKLEEEKMNKRRKGSLADFCFFNNKK